MLHPRRDRADSDMDFITCAIRPESCRLHRRKRRWSASFSCITYRGMYALFRMRENLRAMQMATVVTGARLLARLMLMRIVLMH